MKMKRIIALLLAAAMVLTFAGCGKKAESTSEKPSENQTEKTETAIDVSGVKLMSEGKLTVGCEIGYPPFEDFADDGTTPVGFDIDLATGIAEKLGLEVEFINTGWDGIFQGIDVNYDCVISACTITEERLETMLFSTPYIQNYQTVVVTKDSDLTVESFNDLDGKAIAVQKETTSDILMSDYKDTGSIDVTIVANEKVISCFTQLENGEIDAVVVDSSVADGYLAANPDKFKIAYKDSAEPEEFGVAIGKDNAALLEVINKALAELQAEGYIDDCVKYWFGSNN